LKRLFEDPRVLASSFRRPWHWGQARTSTANVRARSSGHGRYPLVRLGGLTFPPLRAALPRWSPDDTQIAFSGAAPNGPWKLRLVSADGGATPPVLAGTQTERDATWSADGSRLAFFTFSEDPAARSSVNPGISQPLIRVYDLKTRQVATIAGSEDFFSPRWSPDGRYVAALSFDEFHLWLYDFAANK
jgi:Tol biopolymer transport system component